MADAPILLDDADVQFHFRPTHDTGMVVNHNGSNWMVVEIIEADGKTHGNGPLSLDCQGKR